MLFSLLEIVWLKQMWRSVRLKRGGHMMVNLMCQFVWANKLWGESKIVKMACSGSLTPSFVNNDYVTTEIIYRVVHSCHEVYSLGQRSLCAVCLRNQLHLRMAPPKKVVALPLHHSCLHWVSRERREYSMSTPIAAASARREYCYGRCVSQERGCVVLGYVTAALPDRRE